MLFPKGKLRLFSELVDDEVETVERGKIMAGTVVGWQQLAADLCHAVLPVAEISGLARLILF